MLVRTMCLCHKNVNYTQLSLDNSDTTVNSISTYIDNCNRIPKADAIKSKQAT